jgi:hypothetical protein
MFFLLQYLIVWYDPVKQEELLQLGYCFMAVWYWLYEQGELLQLFCCFVVSGIGWMSNNILCNCFVA